MAPSASTSTAIGVPLAPNRLLTLKLSSSTIGERKPSALLTSTVPVETTSNLGASLGGSASQAFRSSSIFWQKPQPGFQKRTSVFCPRKSARLTVLPLRSGKVKAGAGSPSFGPAGCLDPHPPPLPLLP